jgi:hypothetical protein
MSTEASANIEKIINIIREECKKENVEIPVSILSGECSKFIAGEPNTSNVRELFPVTLKNTVPLKVDNPENLFKFAQIQRNIMEEYSETLYCDLNLIPESKVGDNYLQIKSSKFENDEEVFLNSQSGILVLFFWKLNDCGFCDSAMNDYLPIIEKNFDKWNGKVKFFTIIYSEKEEKEKKLKAIEEKNWNKFPEIVEHFYMTSANPAPLFYGVRGYPYLVIADQKSVLRHVYIAHGVNLDEFINEILDGKEFVAEEFPNEEESEGNKEAQLDAVFAKKFDAFQEEAKRLYKEIQSDEAKKADNDLNFQFENTYKFTYVIEKAAIENFRFTEYRYKISCRKNEFGAFNDLLRKHLTEDEILNYKLEIELINETSD